MPAGTGFHSHQEAEARINQQSLEAGMAALKGGSDGAALKTAAPVTR